VGGVSSTIAQLTGTKTTTRPYYASACPAYLSSIVTPYTYVEVRNTNPHAVTVSIYNSQAPNGPVFNTYMMAYSGTTIPTSTTDRENCKGNIRSSGTAALTGNVQFASLDGTTYGVTIPANASVMVYFAAGTTYDPNQPSLSTGPVKLSVKTDSISP
jgi:hypothetical protein